MSLKGFHILFITLSTLLALGVGGWCLWVNSINGVAAYRVGAIFAFVVAGGLMTYGFWFYRKMKRLRIIT